jgi:hypothetical protein
MVYVNYIELECARNAYIDLEFNFVMITFA